MKITGRSLNRFSLFKLASRGLCRSFAPSKALLMSSITLVPKPAPITDSDWEPIAVWVERALDRCKSTENAALYRAACESGQRQLWHLVTNGDVSGVVISEVYDHPKGKTVGMPVTAGSAAAGGIPAVLITIEAWARSIGAVRLEGWGREGWARALKPFGFKVADIVIAKDL